MELSKSEIEQLQLLQTRYQNGHLSSTEYEGAKHAILQGRRSPIDHSAIQTLSPPEEPVEKPNNNDGEVKLPPSSVDVLLLTTCNKSSRQARQTHLRRQQESLDRSEHAKNKRSQRPNTSSFDDSSGTPLTPYLSLNDSKSQNTSHSSGATSHSSGATSHSSGATSHSSGATSHSSGATSHSSGATSHSSGAYELSSSSGSFPSISGSGSIPSLSESILQQVSEDKSMLVPVLAVLTTVLLITVVLLKWTPIESLIARVQVEVNDSTPAEKTALAGTARAAIPKTIPISEYFIKPLYGPTAVPQCLENCKELEEESKQTCQRACAKLSIDDYARRITLADLEPSNDAKLIISRCASVEDFELLNTSRADWIIRSRIALEEVNSAPKSSRLGEFRDIEKIYKKMLDANKNLRLPPNHSSRDKEITLALLESTCIRTNLALTELGILTAQFNLDSFSRRYYYSLYKYLRPIASEAEKATIELAKQQNYFSNVTINTSKTTTEPVTINETETKK